MAAVRHLQITNGLPDPALASFSRLNYALRGLRRDRVSRPTHTRLPITSDILWKVYELWSNQAQDFDRTMLWAAFCLGYFGFMRSGEFTCPSQAAYSPDMLSHGDVSIDSHSCPTYMTVYPKRSKNDPFGAGTTLYLGATGDTLCPVAAMLGYLAIQPQTRGPLFCYCNGATLSRPRLVQSMRQALGAVGVDCTGFSGHSFRIGAATMAASLGVSDSRIQTLGRWRSSAFTRYIRTPWQELAAASSTLAKSPPAVLCTN